MNTSEPRESAPVRELILQTLAMPKDSNVNASIFAGWLLLQMDLAGHR